MGDVRSLEADGADLGGGLKVEECRSEFGDHRWNKRLRDDSEPTSLFSPSPSSFICQDASPPPKKVRANIVQGIIKEKECDGFQPVMMSFKEFLQTQDDSITEEDSLTNYREYKTQFRRQVLATFFNAHKDEEWFRIMYHPVEVEKARLDTGEKKSHEM